MPLATEAALRTLLRERFGCEAFRPFQLEAVKEILDGHDVLLVLPTGGGKSLTYQLPPLTRDHAFTVVISPLLALARDQVALLTVESCGRNGIYAEIWNSETTQDEKNSIAQELTDCETSLKLLYTTPESALTDKLSQLLKAACENGCVLSIAVDEAHCVSTWGHDFRPSYMQLRKLREICVDVPILALTATCTPNVQGCITDALNMNRPEVLKATFNRPNIKYEVVHKELIEDGDEEDILKDLLAFIQDRKGQHGIIYARLRNTCDWLMEELSDANVDVSCYHAGLSKENRRKSLQLWLESKLEVMVATTAFGMGIDKSNVRWVVHWDVAGSIEGFYQESGRAGRDGLSALSRVYLAQKELKTIKKLEKRDRMGAIYDVANLWMDLTCRRAFLLQYFGEKRGVCSSVNGEELCDVCADEDAVSADLSAMESHISHEFSASTRSIRGFSTDFSVAVTDYPSAESASPTQTEKQKTRIAKRQGSGDGSNPGSKKRRGGFVCPRSKSG